jgi:type I restriction enzyme S subunit
MNAEGLLAALAQTGDGPAQVRQMRKIIVALAISGKLTVGDCASGSPHAENLDRSGVAVSATDRSSPRKKSVVTVNQEDLPEGFYEPSRFVRLGSVATIEKGRTGIKGVPPGPYPMVVTAAERIISDHYDFDGAAAIVPLVSSTGHGKASLHRLHYQEGRFALGTILAAIFPHDPQQLSARFLYEYLTTFKEELLVSRMIGTANVSLSIGKIAEVPVPLVDPSTQRKVDELMALCDQLEATRARREATRDQLAAASLARLNAPDPDIFHADTRFALDALPALTTRPDQIKQLRQTILNLAVRGQLVPQDANDESANELIALASIGISEFWKKHRVARNYPAPIEEVPFPAPPSWRWSRMCEIFNVITDGDHQPPPRADEGIAFLTIGNISAGSIDFAGCRLVPETYLRGLPPYRVPSCGDILYTVVGATYGRPVLVNTNRAFCVQRHIAILKPSTAMSTRFLLYLLASSLIYDQASQSATGAAQPTIALKPLRNFLAPVPPINEQHRIVAKVDELMALCDQLEASLTTSETTRSRLLDALLHEALAPATTVNIEHPRAAVSGYVVSRLASKRNFGRTAHMKHLYLAESRLGLKLGGRYMRQAAGPLDTDIYELEKQAEAAGWYTHNVQTLLSGKEKVSYVPGKALKALAEKGVAVLGHSRKEMDRLIDLMGGLKTEQVEIIATLFAAWNDALLDGHTPDDDWTVKEVREHWHASKQRFTPAELHKWLGWMRQNDVVPLGHPPRTMQQTTMEF